MEPNQTELFVKFKIIEIELNCLYFVLNRIIFELNQIVIIGTFEKI